MNDTQSTIGKLLSKEVERDAIHIAVVPVVASSTLKPGMRVGLLADGRVGRVKSDENVVGIVDPFLKGDVLRGDKVWLFLLPNTITSLKHNWTHPAFTATTNAPMKLEVRSASEQWMRAWAVRHMGTDYYGNGDFLSDEMAYAKAIQAGHTHHLGPYESARDHIDDTWWNHWEAITGQTSGERGYFSCAC